MEKLFNLKRCFSQWTSLFFQLLTPSSTSISALEFSNKALKKYMMTKIFMFFSSSVMYCYSAFWEFLGQLYCGNRGEILCTIVEFTWPFNRNFPAINSNVQFNGRLVSISRNLYYISLSEWTLRWTRWSHCLYRFLDGKKTSHF